MPSSSPIASAFRRRAASATEGRPSTNSTNSWSMSMPRTSDEIFPYSTDAIGAAFTRAVQFLEIDDLHFHDLRHDGVSRLFEIGLNIPRVASVSGHRSWTSLKRYTHLRQTGDKYA